MSGSHEPQIKNSSTIIMKSLLRFADTMIDFTLPGEWIGT
jgi:hypothetical protein